MEKKEIVRKIVLWVLIVLVLGLSGFIVWDQFIKEDNVKDSDKAKEVEDEPITEELEGFMFEDTYDYSLNGKNHKITYKYYYNECSEDLGCDISKYVVKVVAYFDETKINTGEWNNIFYGSKYINDYNKIREELSVPLSISTSYDDFKYSIPLNEKNLMTILDESGEEYLVMAIQWGSDFSNSTPDVYIIDEDGKLIFYSSTGGGLYVTLSGNAAKTYKFNEQQFYVSGDKLYYFQEDENDNSDDCSVMIKEVTIKNGKSNENEIKLLQSEVYAEGECS